MLKLSTSNPSFAFVPFLFVKVWFQRARLPTLASEGWLGVNPAISGAHNSSSRDLTEPTQPSDWASQIPGSDRTHALGGLVPSSSSSARQINEQVRVEMKTLGHLATGATRCRVRSQDIFGGKNLLKYKLHHLAIARPLWAQQMSVVSRHRLTWFQTELSCSHNIINFY